MKMKRVLSEMFEGTCDDRSVPCRQWRTLFNGDNEVGKGVRSLFSRIGLAASLRRLASPEKRPDTFSALFRPQTRFVLQKPILFHAGMLARPWIVGLSRLWMSLSVLPFLPSSPVGRQGKSHLRPSQPNTRPFKMGTQS